MWVDDKNRVRCGHCGKLLEKAHVKWAMSGMLKDEGILTQPCRIVSTIFCKKCWKKASKSGNRVKYFWPHWFEDKGK